MKLNNLTIAPKLGILVGVTLLGLCIAGALAGYLMRQEMLEARIEQTHAIVDMARNMAIGLQKEVAAGKLTKEAAIAEFSRRGNSLIYNHGSGYLFGYNMDGKTVLTPDPKWMGKNRIDVLTDGRKITRELRDGIAAHGEVTLYYNKQRPGQSTPIRKLSYAVAIPNWNIFVGTGVY
ncbi:MAG: cache domain-containing protein, partial [Bradyrhizobium sp.]